MANFVARQATLKDIACQATLAFVVETKLLVYNINLHLSASVTKSRSPRQTHLSLSNSARTRLSHVVAVKTFGRLDPQEERAL